MSVWLAFPGPGHEPVYQGRTLSQWAEDMETDRTGGEAQFKTAVGAVGTNAIPVLLRFLRTYDSPLKVRLRDVARRLHVFHVRRASALTLNLAGAAGFSQLTNRAAAAVPELVRIYEQDISFDSKFGTVESLSFIGPDARLAVPALLRDTGSTDADVRQNAYSALAFIHDNPDALVPVFTKGLGDTSGWIQYYSAIGLWKFGPAARTAVPALVEFLHRVPPAGSKNPDIGGTALGALESIDPAAAEKLKAELATEGPGN